MHSIIAFFIDILSLIGSLFSSKLKEFRRGRRETILLVKSFKSSKRYRDAHFTKTILIHASSLGEFEQGRTLINALKERYPNVCIVLTFFSPSGYTVRKDYANADLVCYLPFDYAFRTTAFVKMLSPDIAIFIKYDLWGNIVKSLSKEGAKIILFSANFRSSQYYFSWYGASGRSILRKVDSFYVQNDVSKDLLNSLGLTNVFSCGDGRFDRVATLPLEGIMNPSYRDKLSAFVSFSQAHNRKIVVAGSTWLKDDLLIAQSNLLFDFDLIIAPHDVTPARIKELKQLFPRHILFSEEITKETLQSCFTNASKNGVNSSKKASVLIIDSVGQLSKLYQFAEVAYIGGGFDKGIHNVLEAATWGVPVVFGAKYHKFREARDLLKIKCAFSVKTTLDLNVALYSHDESLSKSKYATILKEYIHTNTGATDKIIVDLAPQL